MNIFIIAGHSKPTPGATAYNGISEHTYTKELQGLVIAKLKNYIALEGSSMEAKTDTENQSNAKVRALINANATKGSRGIDIHFNDNNIKASGCEVIVSRNTSQENKDRASRLVKRVSKCLGIPHRKRVADRDWIYPDETYVGSLGILDKTKPPMLLLEVCFLNENNLPVYLANKYEVAQIIADELVG